MRIPLILIFSLLAAACASYEAGTPATPGGIKSVFIEPVENRTTIPQMRTVFAKALHDAVSGGGHCRIVNRADTADAILRVQVVGHTLEGAAARRTDTARSASFDLSVRADATLLRPDGTVLRGPLRINTDSLVFGIRNDLQIEQYRNLPQVTEELARRVNDRLFSAPW